LNIMRLSELRLESRSIDVRYVNIKSIDPHCLFATTVKKFLA